ncbi:MAG: DUF1801 domain-containing protein [Anaerolineales bacterium]|nr:DUF1801 domain-containing protein [Anaerolineales bacterium]
MAELKTKVNEASVDKFIKDIGDERVREDARKIIEIMQKATKAEPKMWGTSIVGFGCYHYKYASGREGDWMLVGFSPRKQNLTLYIMSGFEEYDSLLKKLGKHSTGKSCLYIKRLEDVDLKVLKELVAKSVRHIQKTHS